MNVRILSNNTQSIARRLALMFALAAAAVFSVTGYALYQYQCVELRRHQLQEIKTRFEFVENLIVRRISNPEKWALLEEKMTELMPQDGSIVYLVESTDPRYRLGKSFAADAKVSNEGNGVRRIVTANGTYLTLSGEIPAGGQRPAVLLTVGLDSSAFDTTSRAINAALLTAFLFGVLVVAVLGWWIARRGLAAVDELSKHAAKLSPLNLAERLPASDLPNELNGLAHSFNGALERVEQAYVQLSTFNSDVAHELRTPLGNLIGQTQVMLSRERSAEELTDVLQSNLEELERLRTIINDMLFLAQADRGIRAANLELLSIAAEVLKSAEFLDMLMEEADVSLVLEGDAEACIDRSLFGRAITNLLYNAIQHCERHSTIRVQIAQDSDHAIAIKVSNRGSQVAAHHLDRLFERFYRVDSARSDSGSSHGLGLAIVKAIAHMHGGTVFAASDADVTSIGFTVAGHTTATRVCG